jgi:hypothetical protein
MTLLLFLASLAVVNYIISRQPTIDRPGSEQKPSVHVPEETAVATPGLMALGVALERHGRGQPPQPGPRLEPLLEPPLEPQPEPQLEQLDMTVPVKNITQ